MALLMVRSSGYTGVAAENGKYFAKYKSTRMAEISREEYEQMRWRDSTAWIAGFSMLGSLFAFAGFESIWFHGRKQQ